MGMGAARRDKQGLINSKAARQQGLAEERTRTEEEDTGKMRGPEGRSPSPNGWQKFCSGRTLS